MFCTNMINKDYVNMKHEIKALFPEMENYVFKSIYDETLRGQVDGSRIETISRKRKTRFKLKKLYHRSPKDKRFKKYLFYIPNMLNYVCPDCLTEENKNHQIEEMEKFFAVLCRRRKIFLNQNHVLILLLVWERVGRWRSIEKKILIEELQGLTNFEQSYIRLLLKELWRAGFLVRLDDAYGINQKLVL